MPLSSPEFLVAAMSAVAAAGAAWGASRAALNGTRERISEMHVRLTKQNDELARHQQHENADLSDHTARLTRLETKVDMLLSGQVRLYLQENRNE